MVVAAGAKLGPYEIVGAVGTGGMGEVYRARDSRLGRDVAVKIIPAAFASDATRVRRFKQEARAAAALNHPNILAIHDIGAQDGAPYIVSELLEGETLRQRLRSGPMPVRKAVDCAIQIASGLAAAHSRGIVHRDLKPENVFVTRDGHVKILDFGLAKLTRPDTLDVSATTATLSETERGLVLGTVGYMSPEQVRGKPADARSDLFSFGAILFEMLSGQRAFKGDTAVDTMTAILTKDPPELTALNTHVPPALEHIVHHCLEKSPDERFQSARDVVFDLEQVSTASGAIALAGAKPRRVFRSPAMLAISGLALVALGVLIGMSRINRPSPPRYTAVTFRRGNIRDARYAPDGRTIIYSATWGDARRPDLFSTTADTLRALPLGISDADVASISKSGEMALLTDMHPLGTGVAVPVGTLATVPPTGGSPRSILENVGDADWSPDGKELAVAHRSGVQFRLDLEYPIGHVLYRPKGSVSHLRFSRDGHMIAFFDHPLFGDDRGSVAVSDVTGRVKTLSTDWESVQGLTWSPSGSEIWFTASPKGTGRRALYAVDLSGRLRLLAAAPGMLTVQDVSANGQALLIADRSRVDVFALGPGQSTERDLSYFEYSFFPEISADGNYVLFVGQGAGSSSEGAVYLRKTDGSPPVRLGDGIALGLSPDRKWVLTFLPSSPAHPAKRLILLPTGPGAPRPATSEDAEYESGVWMPDSKRLLLSARDAQGRSHLFILDTTEPARRRAVGVDGMDQPVPSPNSRFLIARSGNGEYLLCPLEDCSNPQVISGLSASDDVRGWTADSDRLFVAQNVPAGIKVFLFNPWTHRKELYKQFTPADPAGMIWFGPVSITPDGKYYAYGIARTLSELDVVDGLQ